MIVKSDRVTVVGTDIDIVPEFLNCAVEKRLTWCKGEGMGGCGVQNPGVQAVQNLIKFSVLVVEKRSSS